MYAAIRTAQTRESDFIRGFRLPRWRQAEWFDGHFDAVLVSMLTT